MLLNAGQCTGQPLTTKSLLVQNSAKVEKAWCRLGSEEAFVLPAGDISLQLVAPGLHVSCHLGRIG